MRNLFLNAVSSVVFIVLSLHKPSLGYNVIEQASNEAYQTNDDNRRKIRLGFTANSTLHRQLLLTEDQNATPGIDWGYDGAYYATIYDDMYWLIEGELFTIQGTNVVDETSIFPLGFHIAQSGMNTIGIDALENIEDDFNLFLFDNELNVYHNLREGDYDFHSEAGIYLNRFALVFNTNQESDQALSINDQQLYNLDLTYNKSSKTLILHNPSSVAVKGLDVYKVNGQVIQKYTEVFNTVRSEFEFNNATSSGIYMVIVHTEYGVRSKKVIIH
ncbi:MAG: T9SS type A sorting domain-containing protein [Winogradskyella sp.]|uniref:T9SS type A sorting domain-containing protein n=1 Tax=Winogradskyella sp. TaxID=1883156 RepID=UPI0025FB0D72|nr:T9SS type A sorting domain-containing protein [Winogradskyella sp.]NRB82547.1 T9SS type A sorting domain-containing protein [Winogradskyella sp.]